MSHVTVLKIDHWLWDDIGYNGDTLKDFVKLLQEIEREERNVEREWVKEELDFKRLMEKHDKELQIQPITRKKI